MIEIHVFQNVVMTVAAHVSVSVFSDGVVNVMDRRDLDTQEYRDIAKWAGYGDDWREYNLHHDLTHHLLAEVLEKPWSVCLHDPVLGQLCDAPQDHKDEEHLVNRWQRYMRTGEPDEYGILEATFGDQLDALTRRLADVVE